MASDKLTVHVTVDDKVMEAVQAARDENKAQRADITAVRDDVIGWLALLLQRIERLEALPGVAEALKAAELRRVSDRP